MTRSRRLIDLYRETRAAIGDGGAPESYFRTEVVDAVGRTLVWSPIADDEHLPDSRFSTRVDRALMRGKSGGPLGHLFDLLYAGRIQNMDLGMGFRGIPSIGTVFMNRLREQQFFEQILAEAQTDAESVFFAVGSIFGGTGSAAFPVVGRALLDGIRGVDGRADVPGVPIRRIGGALLLPYFTLPTPDTREAADGGPRPETALFAQNAAAAIPTYTTGHTGYGGFYVLGDSEPREQDSNEVGGERQANRAHYIELYSALAALDFAARGGERANDTLPLFRTTAVERSNVRWSDLPLNEASRQRLMGGIIAAHTFLTVFRPNGASHPGLDRYLRGVTWMELLGLRRQGHARPLGGFRLPRRVLPHHVGVAGRDARLQPGAGAVPHGRPPSCRRPAGRDDRGPPEWKRDSSAAGRVRGVSATGTTPRTRGRGRGSGGSWR